LKDSASAVLFQDIGSFCSLFQSVAQIDHFSVKKRGEGESDRPLKFESHLIISKKT
jgi:hypothetical protein